MYRVFIVEDDRTIAESLKKHLQTWGYEVSCVVDFKNVIDEFKTAAPQIVLLDIGLPFFNGFHWCQSIREISDVPIVFISSASDNMNIVMAMNMGGDDFIEKPFDMHVLTAKVQAILRRTYSLKSQLNIIEHQGVILNLSDATVTYEGQKIELSRNEYKIFQMLLERAGKIVPRDDIIEALWESESFIDDNTLTVNMTRLRKKLEEAGLIEFIQTKKGLGYVIP
ncbi:response regulator transcription factor [Bariatricus massiliensis]|uniref:Stage 0 sporulation protein A homolog n=1 Tax=Bariatricus massiliensis TaxID=1745713 RepID=A0ABS8DCT9_9FIRM|nr:response regulator transcription factor [Bariatricus massiliensis]MCB7303424.1 response regulator transcription factor [Bariatricus massiliensis]MCB7373556.1 response regulator transcription factor [Bariatricus massiliensis]MCB7386226.1 response regulator transcription factor [Bariatricus massiliensis]MCB7410388.1 response regulator transcription factor [Bariatricus massiliensis]MCQ5252328.1 response regulator transcription factor [Bariatricus massiliensis]